MSEPWHPHAGQKKGTKFLVEHASAGLFADPGVGKTSCVYAAFTWLKKRGLANRMLVIAPLKPCWLVWPAEAEKWTDFNHLRVEVLHGPGREEAIRRDADVYVINPDGLDWLLGAERTRTKSGKVSVTIDYAGFKALGFDVLVLDELTMWKHTQSGRHKALKQVIGTFGRRWGLTGTPAPNGLIDLFGQCYMLDIGKAFGPYITHFREAFFVPSYDGSGYLLQPGAQERIYERLRPLVLRLVATDYIDMPDVVQNVIKFKLPPDVRRVYDKLEDEMVAWLDDNVVTAVNAAAVSTKLRQVVSGGVYLDGTINDILNKPKSSKVIEDGGRAFINLHDEKTDLVEDLVEELNGQPLLVGYDFHHDLYRLKKRFGDNTPNLGSGMSPKKMVEIERAWNAGEIPLLFGHPASMGHGLNLQGSGNHAAWYSSTWNLELHDQFIGRVARQGSKHKRVFVHYLLAEGTIDTRIFYVIRNKAKTQNALLTALIDMRRRR